MDSTRLLDGAFGSDRLDILTRVEMEESGDERRGVIPSLLLTHPDDFLTTDDDTPSPRLIGGREYVQQNIYMAAWLGVLLVGYIVQRVACILGLPDDCLREINYYEIFSDITSLALYGLALGWFIGINEPSRFKWLFSRKRWYALAVFLCTPPVYSAISNIPALKHDLGTLSTWNPAFIVVWSTGMAAILGVVGWHIRDAWQRAGRAGFIVYLSTRLTLLGWFGASALHLAHQGDVKVHLHHLYIGWALALWADANAGLSAVTLAVGSGIFVQGVGAYSFAPVFSSEGCFETPASDEIRCKFFADAPFTVRVCPSGGAVPEHVCGGGGGIIGGV